MTHTRILLVDDNAVGRYALSRLLRREGFDVIEAATGQEALRLAATAPQPDLIILDVKLPDLSGFTVCQALKQQPATAHLPVLHLSAVYVQEADKVQGLESGADAYSHRTCRPPGAPCHPTGLIAGAPGRGGAAGGECHPRTAGRGAHGRLAAGSGRAPADASGPVPARKTSRHGVAAGQCRA